MFGNIIIVALVFAILIFIHELGHLLACKLSGIKVEKFSLGFGPAILKWQWQETTYMISIIPLGGYIKMEGEDYGATGFFSEPLHKKVLVLTLGPGLNLFLGFVLLAIMYVVFGTPIPEARITPRADSPAAVAGMQNGDLVLTINGDTMKTFVNVDSVLALPESTQLTLRVRRSDGVHAFTFHGVPDSMGINLYYPARIGVVSSGSPAAAAGFARGDRVIRVDSAAVTDWSDFTEIIRASPGRELKMTVVRGKDTLVKPVTPKLVTDMSSAEGREVGQIGIQPFMPTASMPFFTAVWEAFKRTLVVVIKTFEVLWQLITGQVSGRAISGPVMVGKMVYEGVQSGGQMLLAIWAIISINLFVINMLPVPFLDGGRVVLFIYEGIRRKKLTARQWDVALRIGMHLIVLLALYALSNDFLNILHIGTNSQSLVDKIRLGLVIAYAIYGIYDVVRPHPEVKEPEPPPAEGEKPLPPQQ